MLTADDWTAIGTLALAAVTAGTAVTSVVLVRSDRKHDDNKRAEDRAYEASLRTQQAAGLKAAALADRRDREDRDAREVVVRTEGINQVNSSGPNLKVILSAPNVSPVKQVQGALVRFHAGTLVNTTPLPSLPVQQIGDERTSYTFTANTTGSGHNYPLMRFVDWNGNLYYQFRHYTMRFDPGTEWADALHAIEKWSRDGAQRADD
jgi:hypothetical protein